MTYWVWKVLKRIKSWKLHNGCWPSWKCNLSHKTSFQCAVSWRRTSEGVTHLNVLPIITFLSHDHSNRPQSAKCNKTSVHCKDSLQLSHKQQKVSINAHWDSLTSQWAHFYWSINTHKAKIRLRLNKPRRVFSWKRFPRLASRRKLLKSFSLITYQNSAKRWWC